MSKGTILDLLPIMIALFIIAPVILIIWMMLGSFVSPVQQAGLNATPITSAQTALEVFNGGYVLLFFGLAAGAIISAFLVESHPIFAVVSIFLWLIMIFAATIFSNVYNSIASSTQFQAALTRFDVLNLVMTNLPLEIAVTGAIILIVLYGKATRAF